jgi:Zn-dependent peptidase ImmA (M78 family)
MRKKLSFELDERARHANWEVALREFINLVEQAGIMVMVSGVVGCNTRRKLDPVEFRGFALADARAPLIFVNGADSKSAQMFTLAHELAHLWLGQSALSDAVLNRLSDKDIEEWCNTVAAEFLVPLAQTPRKVEDGQLYLVLNDMTKKFKVSSLVILRRLRDAGALDQGQFWSAFNSELKRIETMNEKSESKGGQFFATHALRLGHVFGAALAADALEGRTTFSEAMELMGVKKLDTFEELGRRFGVGF